MVVKGDAEEHAARIDDGAWHHVAFTREGSTGRLYIDGVFVDSRTYPAGPLVISAGGLLLGQDQDCLTGCFDPSQAFDGLIDEVEIYDRALSREEILFIFEAGTCEPGIFEDVNSSDSFDLGEERAGGVGGSDGSVFEYDFDLDAAIHDLDLTSIELLLTTYDNAFRIDVNGATVVPLHSGDSAMFNPPIEESGDANTSGLPRLRVTLTQQAVEFAASETASASEMSQVAHVQPTMAPVFRDGHNTITITNPGAVDPVEIDFRISLRRGDLRYQKISDTRGGFTGLGAFILGLASLGDLDGDGVGDLAATGRVQVGACSEEQRIGVWILFLDANGTVKSQQAINCSEGDFDESLGVLGFTLTALGDLDGDGITELANGDNLSDDGGGARRGAATILFLDTDGTVMDQQRISSTHGDFTGELSDGDEFAIEVAFLGDHNGDGVPDMAAGARRDDDGGTDRGAVWILFLNTDGTVNSHQKISDTEGDFTGLLDDYDLFGESVASLGDLDRDGIGDIAVSAIFDDDGGTDRGAVWILFLDAEGRVKSHQKISDTQGGFTGPLSDGDQFGESLSNLGDLDGDGIVELAVGAYRDDDGGVDRGAVWILRLDSDGTVKSHEKISSTHGSFTGTLDDDDRFGVSVESLGDLSGDGSFRALAVNASRDRDGVGTSRGSFGAGAV